MLRRSFPSLGAAPGTFLRVVGSNKHLAPKACSDSVSSWNDIVGGHGGQILSWQRADAGELLALIDLVAARSALKHTFDGKLVNERTAGDAKHSIGIDHSCATVSMPQIHFSSPISSGDYLELKSSVVDVGSSSLSVHVSVDSLRWPLAPGEMRRTRVSDAFTSFVAIGRDLKALKGVVPPLGMSTDAEIVLNKRAVELREQERIRCEEETAIQQLSLHDARAMQAQLKEKLAQLAMTRPWKTRFAQAHGGLRCQEDAKIASVKVKDATLSFNKVFMGKLNLQQSVFGGEIMASMERSCLFAARRFCGNTHCYSLGVSSLQFHEPVLSSDFVSLQCRVIHVRNSTVEVDCKVVVDRTDGRHLTSNCASFVVVNMDPAGKPRPIPVGLDMSEATVEEHRAAAASLARYVRLAAQRLDRADI